MIPCSPISIAAVIVVLILARGIYGFYCDAVRLIRGMRDRR